jgi:hypothetical protein
MEREKDTARKTKGNHIAAGVMRALRAASLSAWVLASSSCRVWGLGLGIRDKGFQIGGKGLGVGGKVSEVRGYGLGVRG